MNDAVLAATLFGAEDLRMVEAPLGPLAPGMVRVRFGAGGICGSDMHYFRHGRTGDFVVETPLIVGHETGLLKKTITSGYAIRQQGTLEWRKALVEALTYASP